MWGGGAADHDINVTKESSPIFEMNRGATEFSRQSSGALVRTVGYDDTAGTAGKQRTGGFLAGVTGADNHHVAVIERGENLFGQFHGHGPDRNAAALNIRF